MSWNEGVAWATMLGKLGLGEVIALMGALLIMGALVEGMTRGSSSLEREIDGD